MFDYQGRVNEILKGRMSHRPKKKSQINMLECHNWEKMFCRLTCKVYNNKQQP